MRTHFFIYFLLIVLITLLPNTNSYSLAVATSPGVVRSFGSDLLEKYRQDEPLAPEKNKQSGFQLPRLETPVVNQPLSRQLRFFCRRIRLIGNSVIPSSELEKLTRPYNNRTISNQDLQELRYNLTRYYVDQGYINSGAVIPDQDLKDGIITIKLVEGHLTEIDIEGNEHFRKNYLKDRIELPEKEPLQLGKLQEKLQLLLENPLIERINSELKPGAVPGQAILKTLLKEKIPYQIGAVFDNQIAPSIGEYEGTVFAAHRNLTGNGDAFSAQGRFAQGLTGFGLDYWLPVNRYDTSVHGWYSHYDSNIIQKPFNQIDVTSNSESWGFSLMQPIYRKPGITFAGTLTLEHRHSETFLLGKPYSFSEGVQNGKSTVTAIRIGQEWTSRSTEQVIAARSVFNIGIDALDATINSNAADGRFFSWLGQFQWARRINSAQLIFRTDGQLSNAVLLPLEKFQVGGANSVRGYRENQLVRDQGFSSSLEYRYPLFKDFFGENRFFIAPFTDVGGAWNINNSQNLRTQNVLASVGLGLIWDPVSRIHTQFYWGKALIKVQNPGQSIQDDGIHFKVSGQVF